MSNFGFLNQPEPMQQFPAYGRIYQYAVNAENSYFRNKGECAKYVRYTLEQFCLFITNIKKLEYSVPPRTVGAFWKEKDSELNLLRAIGKVNLDYIRQANGTANSFLHCLGTRDMEGYEEMLRSLYKVLLWMYKVPLGMKTSLRYESFDVKKIPENGPITDPLVQDPKCTPEDELRRFQEVFPNCDVNCICNVIEKDNRYVITDLYGKETGIYVPQESLELSEQEKADLVMQLTQVETRYAKDNEYYRAEMQDQNEMITQLQQKLRQLNLEQANSEEDKIRLKKQIEQAKNELQKQNIYKEELQKKHQDKVQKLQNQYSRLMDKYVQVRDDHIYLQKANSQIKNLLKERNSEHQKFIKEKQALLAEIKEVQEQLARANETISSVSITSRESVEQARHLQQCLEEKEKELKQQLENTEELMKSIQQEAAVALRQYQEKNMRLETLLDNVVSENNRYKQKLQQYEAQCDWQYLQLVRGEVMQIQQGFQLYAQNPNERKLREYLLKVKEHYESAIRELEEEVQRLQEELERKNASEQYSGQINVAEQVISDEFFGKETNKTSAHTAKQNESSDNRRKRKKKSNPWVWLVAANTVVLVAVLLFLLGNYGNQTGEGGAEQQENLLAGNDVTEDKAGDVGQTTVPVTGSGEIASESSVGSEEKVTESSDESGEKIPEHDAGSVEDGPEQSAGSGEREPEQNIGNDDNSEKSSVDETTGEGWEESVSETTEESIEASEPEELEVSQENPTNAEEKLEELLQEKAHRDQLPETISEIPGMHEGLKKFLTEDGYKQVYKNGLAGIEYLGEVQLQSYQKEKIYISEEYDWATFMECYPNAPGFYNSMSFYVEPSVISSELSFDSTIEEVAYVLGERQPTGGRVSDFARFEPEGSVRCYTWRYTEGDYRILIMFYFADDKMIDYVEVGIYP